MARLARSTILGFPHHVIQRGNYDQPVFECEADYRRYLSWLQEYTAHYAVDVWAYCLMPNHVHIICVPKAEEALARAFNTLHMRYAQYFNGKRSLRGHLWRARFMSCVLDESSVREEVRFVENNPVRLKLVERAEDYPWSSARSHVTGELDPVLSDGCFLTAEVRDWRGYLEGRGEEAVVGRARARLRTGRPAGDPEFVWMLEKIMGRRLGALPRGRPRKMKGFPKI
jgi:putative transposase